MKTVRFFGLIVVGFLFTSCGESFESMREPYLEDYAKLQEKVDQAARLAESVFEQTDQPLFADPVDPPPFFRDKLHISDKGGEGVNCDFFMLEHLLDLDATAKHDLILSGYLKNLLPRVDPTVELDDYFRKPLPNDRAIQWERDELENGRNVRYLLVARNTDFEPVTVISDTQFAGGAASFEVILIDLLSADAPELKARFQITAKPSDTARYTYQEGAGEKEKLERAAGAADFSMKQNAVAALRDELAKLYPGSKFETKEIQ